MGDTSQQQVDFALELSKAESQVLCIDFVQDRLEDF